MSSPILRLPNELLLHVASYTETDSELNAFHQANRHLYHCLNDYLYRRNAARYVRMPRRKHEYKKFPEAKVALCRIARWGNTLNAYHKALVATPRSTKMGACLRDRAFFNSIEEKREEFLLLHLRYDEHIDLNQSDAKGRTPLVTAASTGSVPIARILLDAGADVNVGGKRVPTVLFTPRSGYKPLTQAVDVGNVEMIRFLLSHGADPNAKDDENESVFLAAVRYGNLEIVDILLETGLVDLEERNLRNDPLFSVAVDKKAHDVAKRLMEMETTDMNAVGASGRTALMYAVMNKDLAMVELLLSTGKADLDIADTSGETVTELARRFKDEDITKALQQATRTTGSPSS